MIHTTIGIYPSLNYKINGVKSENLAEHIKYNLTFRPGRALLVDGVCIYKARFTFDQANSFELEYKDKKVKHDSAPYV